jgi:hypothetical protein
MFPQNRFNTKNNKLQHTKVNNKHSALLCISVRSQTAYANHISALPNAKYSRSVYLHFMCVRQEGNIGKCTVGGKVGGDTETAETLELVINHSFRIYISRNFKSNTRR